MYNNLTAGSGSAGYDPFFEITSPGHETVYLAQDSSLFKIDAGAGSGKAFWKDGERHFSKIR
jgi:hypothetical protein